MSKMEQNIETNNVMPLSKTIAVLVSFPIIATLISLLLLNRTIITDLGLSFFNTFWIIIIGWYVLQIFIISRVLIAHGWKWKDIGYPFSSRKTAYFIGGYLLFAIGLLIIIELALANSTIDVAKLEALSSLTPKTTTARIFSL